MYRKSKRSRTLVGKGGRITSNSRKNVANLIDKIRSDTNLTQAEKITLENDLNAYVDVMHRNGLKLTESGFFARYETDKISRMLTNAGYTAEELADEIGVTAADILNSNNWNGDIFMGMWQLEFQYTGELLRHV